MGHEVHIEAIVGRKVLDPDGRSIGRLEEVRVEQQGTRYVVSEYLIGQGALLERLSVGTVRRREAGVTGGYRAWWHQLDLADPEHPRLRCRVEELRRFEEES